MFSLVSFMDEQDEDGSVPCEIVPKTWFASDLKTCWWPPGLNGYSNAFPKTQPKNTWRRCKNFEIKFSSDDLKEVRRRRIRYITNLDTSNVESESEVENASNLRGRFTRSACTSLAKARSHESGSESDDDFNLAMPPPVPVFKPVIVTASATTPPKATTNANEHIQAAFQNSQLQVLMNDGNVIDLEFNAGNSQVATMDVQHLILKKIEALSRKVDDLTSEVRELKPISQPRSETLGDVPKHPATTFEELEELNSYCLLSNHNAGKLGLSLSYVGGKTLKEATENVMAELMVDTLAMEYNWKGTKRGEAPKQAFKNFKLASVIYDSVRKMKYHASAQNSDIISHIQIWLKNSKGRSTGWKKTREEAAVNNNNFG